MPVGQGRHGYFDIGGVKYPCFNVAYTSPRNLIAGMPVGNSWASAHAEGARSGRVVAQMFLREKSTEMLSATFWNLLMTRTFSAGFDDTGSFTLKAATGRRLRTLANAKFESVSVGVSFGGQVGLTCVFVSPAPASKADETQTTYAFELDNSPPLMFDKATFSGITGPVHGFEFTYANNHQPNAPLNGTKFLTSWDAGPFTCAAKVTVPEHVAANEPFADEANLTMSLVGGVTRVFSFTAVVPNTPDDVNITPGQLFQTYDCLVKGNATTPPLVIT